MLHKIPGTAIKLLRDFNIRKGQTMERWVVAAKRADFQAIGQEFHIDPVIARLIRNRDIIDSKEIREYLYGSLADLPSPWLMKDMEKAVSIVEGAIQEGEKIRIIGDYRCV